MTTDEKLKYFDPSDTNNSMGLAYATLALVEHCYAKSDLHPRECEALYLLAQRAALQLKLYCHEAKDVMETTPEIIRRVLK